MRRVCIFILPLLTCLACIDNTIFNPVTQFKSDTASIRSFLELDGIKATMTPQGVWYSIDDSTLGYYPALSDSVVIKYTAWLLPTNLPNNQIPISSLKKAGSSATTKSSSRTVLLSSVISGIQLGLSKFPVGSSGKLFIPSGLAFGPVVQDSVPANSNLVYEIKLMSATGARVSAEQGVIDNYVSSISDDLFSQGLKQSKDATSGIRFAYDTIITANSAPTLNSSVNISYSASVLNAITPFVTSTDTTLVLKDQITAFKIIFPEIRIGTTFWIYVPSSYAYGSDSPSLLVPANSNLIYQITLKDVR
ncbi:MAG TPA: FKBP-type peptidyl-prolyl cis-trans isomerase [Cyclobacteriaceae bacterium]|jgi:FKBP-type peptidyl-prolyl cis-trans isomerase|nr:FKBP-type peptidyl-prolyl cis-trans isomerase [Cyclobacteriaceae bacterium]